MEKDLETPSAELPRTSAQPKDEASRKELEFGLEGKDFYERGQKRLNQRSRPYYQYRLFEKRSGIVVY